MCRWVVFILSFFELRDQWVLCTGTTYSFSDMFIIQPVRFETGCMKDRWMERPRSLTARVLWQRAYQVCSLMPLIVLNDSPPRGEGSTRQYGVWLALFWDRWVVRGVTALKKDGDYAKKYEIRVLNNSYFGIKPQLGFYANSLTMDIAKLTVCNGVF